MSGTGERRDRLARVVSGVLCQAVTDGQADGLLLLGPEGPEAVLAREWCVRAVGSERVWSAAPPAGSRTLSVHPANKTALLLVDTPAAALLPLGDVYASEVRELTGDWSAPAMVQELARQAGDVALLDQALRRWAEERRDLEEALGVLPAAVAGAVAEALRRQRSARWRSGLVPKLGGRTVGIDLWE